MRIERRYQVLLIVFVVLGLFYPAIFAGENSVDDYRMLQEFVDAKFDLFRLFTPTGGFYYRPLLILSFWVDQYVWGGATSFMHLENLLLHALNAVLVFLLVEKTLSRFGEESDLAPLLAGLLFSVHPIVTESVNWISGRTDLLGTFFVLLTTLTLLTAGSRRSIKWTFFAAGFFACAVMSKEVMVFFFPIACLILWHAAGSSRAELRQVAVFALPFIILGALFVVLRLLLVPSSTPGVDALLAKWHYNLFDTLRVTFKVFGFYVKKLIVPVPLNFTIRQVSDFYAPLGLGIGVLSIWLIVKNYRIFFPFAVAIWMIVPAIIIALTNIAWTPLAERYIYLSSAFFAIGCAPLFIRCGRKFGVRIGLLLLAILLVTATVTTAQRNLVWQDNYLLFVDTLKQNPDFAAAHNELGIALIDAGKTAEAERVLCDAIAAGKGKDNPLLYVNLAGIYFERKEYLHARQCLEESYANLPQADLEVLKMMTNLYERALVYGDLMGFPNREALIEDMIKNHREIYVRSGDTSHLYRTGQLLLGLKRESEAAGVFAEVVVKAPTDAYYYPAAQILATKLKARKN